MRVQSHNEQTCSGAALAGCRSRFSRCSTLLNKVCLAIFIAAPQVASAIELPTLSLRRPACITVAGLQWQTDYATARDLALCEEKMLLVVFLPRGKSEAQQSLDKYLSENEKVRNQLKDFVLLRVPRDAKSAGRKLTLKKRGRLIDQPAFQHLGREAGLAIIDFKHTEQPYFRRVVTALPFADGKFYRWQNSHLAVALELPAGAITQRTMVWAVRTHPEHPQSTAGKQHPELAKLATDHSAYQASIGVQGHQQWESRYHLVVSRARAGTAKEVVAESWPNQDLIDSCIDCVQSWRQSSGHWSAVDSPQRLFGYDIRKGSNGIWYGTGIFAD